MCCPSYAWRLLDLDAQHGFHRTDDHLQNLNVNKLNITYLNVCGIGSKLLNSDFETLINNYDILVLVETKTDEYDNIKLPNEYACYAKHRKFLKKKSGGIIIIYKKIKFIYI
jgi:GR25 family glycosyltransferase involved in LPS biosynthesis